MLKKLLFASALASFALSAHAQTIVWSENFDGSTSLPTGWAQETAATDGGWLIGDAEALSSSFFAPPARTGNVAVTNDDGCGATCDKLKDLLKTPVIDLTAQASNELFLVFDVVYYDLAYQGIQESFKVVGSEDGGTTWTDLSSVPGAFGWSGQLVDVTAYAGKSNVKFGFYYSDGGGFLYGAAIDDVKIAVKDDIVRAKVGTLDYGHYITAIPGTIPATNKGLPGMVLSVSGSMKNTGFPKITSFNAVLTYGTNSYTKVVNNIDVGYGAEHSFDFSNDITVGVGSTDISLLITNINGGSNDDPSDNTYASTVKGISLSPTRKVVAEEGTGTWCQWCPRGAVMMEYMTETYPDNFIGVAVHNSTTDPMRLTAYDVAISAIIPGYPGGLVDRVHNVDPTEFEKFFLERSAEEAKVVVTQQVTFDSATRKATVYSKLKFTEEMNGNYSIAVVFTEDGVTGTSSGYAQKNAYAGGAAGPMGGYENKPATVPAAQMVYDHVARALIGGFNGASNSVPTTNPAGSEHYYTVNYNNIPATYKVNKMHAITMVIDTDKDEIINAGVTSVPNVSVGADEPADLVAVSMFPNPVKDEAALNLSLVETSDVQVRVMDALGKIYVEQNYSSLSGEQQLPLRVADLPVGSYLLTVSVKGQTVAKPFVIAR